MSQKKKRKTPKIIKIISRTPGGLHSWVEAEVEGRRLTIRKPNASLQNV